MIYDSLVLSGGGVKGIGMLGSLYRLYSEYENVKFNRIIGVSVGSLLGFLLTIGYKPDEIKEIMLGLNFVDYQDPRLENLMSDYGLDNFDGMTRCFIEIAKKKHPNIEFKDITFSELYELTGINFVVVVSNVTKSRAEFWDYETVPNMSVMIGLRCSMSIPFFFEPWRDPVNGDLFVDGGLMKPFPMDLVKNDIRKIGIYIGPNHLDKLKTIINFGDYMMSIFKSLYDRFSELEFESNREDCCQISLKDINAMEMDLSREDKLRMFEIGINAMCEFLENKND